MLELEPVEKLAAIEEQNELRIERAVETALVQNDWSIKYAALALGVGLSTLQRMLADRFPALDRERKAYIRRYSHGEMLRHPKVRARAAA